MRHAHPAVEPRAAAEAAEHRDFDRAHHGGARHRSGIGEVEKRGARILQKLRLLHELRRHLGRRLRSGRGLGAVGNAISQRSLRRDSELGEDRNAGAGKRTHRLGKIGRAVELDQVGAAFLDQANGGAHRALRPFLQRPVGKVATHQRARHAAADRLADRVSLPA